MPGQRPSDPMIEARGVASGYGTGRILHDVSLTVRPGQCIGLMGRNGMGKTTLIRTLMGLLPLQDGTILLHGANAARFSTAQRARAGIAVVPEGRGIFASLSVLENLNIAARASPGGASDWNEARVLDLFPRLRLRARNRGNQLSGGEQQMLAIGRALMTNPRLLILDEATEGLAPIIRDEIWRVIRHVREAGVATIVVDKTVSALLSLADEVLVLVKGRVAYSGPPGGLARDPALMHRHLGVEV